MWYGASDNVMPEWTVLRIKEWLTQYYRVLLHLFIVPENGASDLLLVHQGAGQPFVVYKITLTVDNSAHGFVILSVLLCTGQII